MGLYKANMKRSKNSIVMVSKYDSDHEPQKPDKQFKKVSEYEDIRKKVNDVENVNIENTNIN